MLSTYKAVLRGDRLEWMDTAPPGQRRAEPVQVEVTILRDSTDQAGAQMAAALGELADMGGSSIEDPLAWQRDRRQDRSLPGRD